MYTGRNCRARNNCEELNVKFCAENQSLTVAFRQVWPRCINIQCEMSRHDGAILNYSNRKSQLGQTAARRRIAEYPKIPQETPARNRSRSLRCTLVMFVLSPRRVKRFFNFCLPREGGGGREREIIPAREVSGRARRRGFPRGTT